MKNFDGGFNYLMLRKQDLLIRKEDFGADNENWSYLRCSNTFVDKSWLIQAIFDNFILGIIITRPRRWGKTVNLSMIQYFCQCPLNQDGSINKGELEFKRYLFQGGRVQDFLKNSQLDQQQRQQFDYQCQIHQLNYKAQLLPLKISQSTNLDSWFSKFTVLNIVLNFSLDQNKTIYDLRKNIVSLLLDIMRQDDYLRRTNSKFNDLFDQMKEDIRKLERKQEISQSKIGAFANRLLQSYFTAYQRRQIVIVIDAFDHAYNNSLVLSVNSQLKCSPTEIATQISNFISIFLKGVRKQSVIRKVICTGIKNAYLQTSFSGTGPLLYQTIDASISFTSQFYGFLEKEIEDQLVDRIFKDKQMKKNIMRNIEKYYNGYKFKQISVFNPYSVMKYLQKVLLSGKVQKKGLPINDELCFWKENKAGQGLLKVYLDQMSGSSQQIAFQLLQSLQDPKKQVKINQQKINIKNIRQSDIVLKGSAKQYGAQDIIKHLITTGYLTTANVEIMDENTGMTKLVEIVKIPNEEASLLFSGPLYDYFKELLKKGCPNLTQLRKDFDIKNWQSCCTLLKLSLNHLLRLFKAANEALMSALMLLQFVICLEGKYLMNYDKILVNIRPDIIFYPEDSSQMAIIHENKIVLPKDYTNNIVQRKKQQALFLIFKNNYLKAFIETFGRKYQKYGFILRGVVGYRQKEGQQFKVQIVQKRLSYQESKKIYQFSILLQYYFKRDNLKMISSIEKLVKLLRIPSFQKAQSTENILQVILAQHRQEIYHQNINILNVAQRKWLQRKQQQQLTKSKLDKIYCMKFGNLIQFLNMWFWRSKKLNAGQKEWSELKYALKMYFEVNEQFFKRDSITVGQFQEYILKQITPIYEQQANLKVQELEKDREAHRQQEKFEKTKIIFQLDEKEEEKIAKLLARQSTGRKKWQERLDKQGKY